MLKYLNEEKTVANFNGLQFTLESPEDFGSISDEPTKQEVLEFLENGGVAEEYSLPTVNPIEVKTEAQKRILEIMPDYEQRNVLAMGMEASQKYGYDPKNWPEALQTLNNLVWGKWSLIKKVRNFSNAIEAMTPIPRDFVDDKYWMDADDDV